MSRLASFIYNVTEKKNSQEKKKIQNHNKTQSQDLVCLRNKGILILIQSPFQ